MFGGLTMRFGIVDLPPVAPKPQLWSKNPTR